MEDEGTTLLLPYDEDKFLDYINFALPVKESLFEQKEKLLSGKMLMEILKPQALKEKILTKRFCLGFAHVTPMVLLIWIDFI